MIMSAHIAAGAAIAVATGRPVLAFPLAFISHYLLDMIPHWQETLHPYKPHEGTYRRIVIDSLVLLCILMLAIQWHPDMAWLIIGSATLALLPDIDSFLVYLPALKRGVVRLHWRIHCYLQSETDSAWGLLPQIAVIAIAFYVLTTR